MKMLVTVAALLGLAVLTGAARADGGPVFNDDGGLRGIETATGYRYTALVERHRTTLLRIAPDQHIARILFLPGRFTIPGVAMDGTTSGLSADGKTLVLIEPRWFAGRKHTRFMLMSVPGMHGRGIVTLPGDFTFDAMAPDASVLYFIHYLSKRDPTQYEVRAFDTEGRKLVPSAIVDRSEPDEEMRGYPVSRVMSAGGRYAYTLYDGGGNTPFVHVLDTIGGKAHCVDLDELAGRQDLYSFRLRREPTGDVAVLLRGSPFLVVEKTSFRVADPDSAAPTGDDQAIPWKPIGAGVVVLVVLGVLSVLALRRRRPAPA
jgi:hypothetical protein